jgi:hypothetical protein
MPMNTEYNFFLNLFIYKSEYKVFYKLMCWLGV